MSGLEWFVVIVGVGIYLKSAHDLITGGDS